MTYRVLIVEDDQTIASAVRAHAERWGLEARCVQDFHNVLGELRAFDPQLVLMDIALPCRDGYYWCGELRRFSTVPVIFLSSASDNMNIVMAMSMGGDDFIAKPFDLSVLMAKIQAMLRRAYDYVLPLPAAEHRGARLDSGDLCLHYNGARIALTKNEHRILAALLENCGKVVSREKLMTKLWETDSFVDDNTLTVNVNRLRRKLDAAGLSDFISTRHGVGYVIE